MDAVRDSVHVLNHFIWVLMKSENINPLGKIKKSLKQIWPVTSAEMRIVTSA